MSLCDIFPDDPSCAEEVDPNPVDVDNGDGDGKEDIDEEEIDDGEAGGVEDEDDGKPIEDKEGDLVEKEMVEGKFAKAAMEAVKAWQGVKSLQSFAELSPMLDHLKLVLVAGTWAASGAMVAFRYRSESSFYDKGKIGDDSNWWKLGDQLRNFGSLGVGSVLALTSLLATFGIANSVNMMAWEYLGLGSMLLSVAIGVIRFMGYDAAYGHSQSSDATKKANGSTTMNAILEDSLVDAAMEVSSMITLASAREGVAYAFWNTLEDAEQDARVAEWEDKVDERAKEIED